MFTITLAKLIFFSISISIIFGFIAAIFDKDNKEVFINEIGRKNAKQYIEKYRDTIH